MRALVELGFLLSTASFLGGLKFMSSPQRAKLGNTIAALGMVLALVTTFVANATQYLPLNNLLVIFVPIILGVVLGRQMSNKIEMTAMPQMVSLFNATGGGCAFLLAIVESHGSNAHFTLVHEWLLISGVFFGAIAFTGSILAYLKLAGKKIPVWLANGAKSAPWLLVLMVVITIAWFTVSHGFVFSHLLYILSALALVYGLFFVIPIGGADMPVVISFLNSVTGIATALSGILFANKVMIAGGILVGAAGIFLTFLMCKAMNKSLFQLLLGKKKSHFVSDDSTQDIQATSISETVLQLSLAQKIAIVPGYGMAVSQAQHTCAQMHKILQDLDKEVHYIIHPVAGRMPGHMNVLLAEANIDYQYLMEMDIANDTMSQYDVVLVIGANDVVNTAAENNSESPIYGMPIIKAYESKHVVVIKRSMNNGYAGVRNELFDRDNCYLLFGDGKVVLQELGNQLKHTKL